MDRALEEKKSIRFNSPLIVGTETEYLRQVISQGTLDSSGYFNRLCRDVLESSVGSDRVFLTASGSQALEFAALLCGIGPGDEVIMSSYTYYSTANAFLLRGARIVFVDIAPETMTMDASLVEAAITEHTKAVVAVHYGGVSPDLDMLQEVCDSYDLFLIEDAAQSLFSSYKDRALGSIGQVGCLSFHATKNITSAGEGGALLVNDPSMVFQAEMIAQHGTNRKEFLEGGAIQYTWYCLGSSYGMNELSAAFLYAQLLQCDSVQERRMQIWYRYRMLLEPLVQAGSIRWQHIPSYNHHNGHLFYIKTASTEERAELVRWCRDHRVETATHYVPLHTTPYGTGHTRFHGEDRYTTSESQRLLRLPLHNGLSDRDVDRVAEVIDEFYGGRLV